MLGERFVSVDGKWFKVDYETCKRAYNLEVNKLAVCSEIGTDCMVAGFIDTVASVEGAFEFNGYVVELCDSKRDE